MVRYRKRIGIWVEANEYIGFGHITRMLYLAEVLRRSFRTEVIFYTHSASLAVSLIRRSKFPAHILSRDSSVFHSAQQLSQYLILDQVQKLVVDLPRALSKSVATLLRQASGALILIDDLGSARRLADFTINAIDHMAYRERAFGTGEIIEGSLYMILRPRYNGVYVSRRQHFRKLSIGEKKYPRHVLITFGGSDSANLSAWTLIALRKLPKWVTLSLLLGPGYRYQRGLHSLIRRISRPLKIFQSQKNPYSLYSRFDLVLTHFGITVYELAYLGVPSALIHPTLYHHRVAEVFCKRKSAVNLGFYRYLEDEIVREKILQLLEDPQTLQALSDHGKKIVDGKGVQRVAKLICSTSLRSV